MASCYVTPSIDRFGQDFVEASVSNWNRKYWTWHIMNGAVAGLSLVSTDMSKLSLTGTGFPDLLQVYTEDWIIQA